MGGSDSPSSAACADATCGVGGWRRWVAVALSFVVIMVVEMQDMSKTNIDTKECMYKLDLTEVFSNLQYWYFLLNAFSLY
jgi:hypothetical protein